MALRSNGGQGLFILEVSRLHSDTSQSMGFLWTSNQLDKETLLPDNTRHSQQTSMPATGFELTVSAGERLPIHSVTF